jgi:hypothetical protein
MIESISSFIGVFVGLIFWELIKMFGLTLFKSAAPETIADACVWLDKRMPTFLAQGRSSEDVEALLRERFGTWSGQEWAKLDSVYSVRKLLDNNPQ